MGGGGGGELERIRELRERGLTPKQIARAVGLPPARVTHLVRTIAAQQSVDPTQRPVVECWVSAGWNAALTVNGHPDWPVDPAAEETGTGLIGVLVAREAGRDRASMCAWLVDVYCLGVKNDMGPDVVYRSELPRIVHDFFGVFGERPLAAPLELAQHLVFGAVDYARSLGFEPAEEADFDATRGHLGPWEGPSAITFGRYGEPFYVEGPNDHPVRVLRQLERVVGPGNFDHVAMDE